MQIRAYNPRDKDQVLMLFNQFGDYFVQVDDLKRVRRGEHYAQHFFAAMQKDMEPNGICYVAEAADSLVGFISGNWHDITMENSEESMPHRKGRILEFFVREEERGKGVGKQLMLKLEEYLRSQGCTAINVEVFAPNESAREFYEEFGYRPRNIDMMKLLE
jgi:GNAT superfamily N-acetyltransferase